jgi:hypothetical protein
LQLDVILMRVADVEREVVVVGSQFLLYLHELLTMFEDGPVHFIH